MSARRPGAIAAMNASQPTHLNPFVQAAMSTAAEEGIRTASLRSLAFELLRRLPAHRVDSIDSNDLESADLLDFA